MKFTKWKAFRTGFSPAVVHQALDALSVGREAAKKRIVAKLHDIKRGLSLLHVPIALVNACLRKVVAGYYQYHAVPGNLIRLKLFRWLGWHALSRRMANAVAFRRIG